METNKNLKKIVLCIVLFIVGKYYSQTNTENYIQTRAYLVPVTSTNSSAKQIETIQYIDGLGRSKQVVNVKASPTGKDIVKHIEYDQYGRKAKEYLPIPQSGTQNGEIYISPLSNTNAIYGAEKIYSKKIYDDSPFNRVYQQIQPGNDWTNKPVNFVYDINTVADGVRKFTTLTIAENGATKSTLVENSLYTNGQLYKNNTIDEDGNTAIEFKNAKGQLILLRKVVNATENADTYYVYNEYDQLAIIIPPMASIRGDIVSNTTKQDELCYYYRYDGKNRLVEKKLPGKDWEYMVYDKQDRLVLTQDANLRKKGQWLFTKYDQFSRPIYTGILDSSPGRIQQLAVIEGHASNYETRNTSSWNNSGLDIFYTNTHAYPTANFKVLSVNYYDTYPNYNFNPPFPANIQGEIILSDNTSDSKNTRGMPVMNLIKNIEDDNWTKNYTYYDTKGRVIGTHSINHLGGYTKKETKLDFAGVPQAINTYHLRKPGEIGVSINEHFVYDNGNRLKEYYHQVDGNPEQLLVKNSYNELSQLVNKEVGNNLQSIDYAYNIRGWMTDINPNQMPLPDLGGKLFAYKIKYNQKEGIENPDQVQFVGKNVVPKYNGNIAEVDWRTMTSIGANPSVNPKRYGYAYDGLNRLTAAYYQNPTNAYSKENIESLSYDLNGNITTLYRTALLNTGTNTATVIDNLTYVYSGNQVISINDNSNNSTGYEGGGRTISYDINGNMKDMRDKRILGINYNYLNLPNSFTFGPEFNTSNLYRTDGVKLRKRNVEITDGINGTVTSTTDIDYLDGFQYSHTDIQGGDNPGGGGIIDFSMSPMRKAMEIEAYSIEERKTFAKTLELKFFPTAEGFYDYEKDQYIYQYKDHLGNARISFGRSSTGVLEITDVNDYYPFGMNHLKSGNAFFGQNTYKNYKYQGQELQETGFYSFKWRNYDPSIGRFFNIDPLSENYAYQSHYNFSENRVVDGVELEGLEAFPFEILLDNAGIEPLSSGMEPLLEPKMPVEPMAEPAMEAVPNEIDAVELTKFVPREIEPAGLEIEDFKIENSLDEALKNNQPENLGKYFSDRTLPRKGGGKSGDGEPLPDVEALGRDHTQLGNKIGRKGQYNQAREFDKNGKPVRDIDFTDHGRPSNHTDPHVHDWKPNQTGGTLQRSKEPQPLIIP